MTRRYAKRALKVLADALEARRGNVIKIETKILKSRSKITPLPNLHSSAILDYSNPFINISVCYRYLAGNPHIYDYVD
jgi:hypothetical protein